MGTIQANPKGQTRIYILLLQYIYIYIYILYSHIYVRLASMRINLCLLLWKLRLDPQLL